jgi:hypothetical protein
MQENATLKETAEKACKALQEKEANIEELVAEKETMAANMAKLK